MKKIINTPNAPAAIGPYSQAVLAGNTLYISGQIPINPATKTVPEGITAQTEQVMQNIKAILDEAGYTFQDVVKSTCLLAESIITPTVPLAQPSQSRVCLWVCWSRLRLSLLNKTTYSR